jgi:hypothetical protein
MPASEGRVVPMASDDSNAIEEYDNDPLGFELSLSRLYRAADAWK